MSRAIVKHITILGDSLSDTGNLKERTLAGLLRMGELSGLEEKSTTGRFTNGFAWNDNMATLLERRFKDKASQLRKKSSVDTQAAAANSATTDNGASTSVIAPGSAVAASSSSAPDMPGDTQQTVFYGGSCLIRNYSEGGLTANNYSGAPSMNPKLFFSRLILGTLSQKNSTLRADDQKYHITPKQKARTLIIEWSGANDFITVNSTPSKIIAEKAIAARVESIKQLMGKSELERKKKPAYLHFCLFNMPDLSLTPRFQRKSQEEQKNAKECCVYFNQKLKEACEALETLYSDASNEYGGFSIQIFDVFTEFTRVYGAPHTEGFDANKLAQPYTESPGFKKDADHDSSEAKQYMFWDDVHPSAAMHQVLSRVFLQTFEGHYDFRAPRVDRMMTENREELRAEVKLIIAFKQAYAEEFRAETSRPFGSMRRTRLEIALLSPRPAIAAILRHALYEKGKRTRSIIFKLGWIDENNNVPDSAPAVVKEIFEESVRHLEHGLGLRS